VSTVLLKTKYFLEDPDVSNMHLISVGIAAGILVIISEQTSSIGVMVASIILLNAGVFPFIAATLGLIRIMQVNIGLWTKVL
jgi:hypothetical protein